jgi:hypothetical protein
MRKGLADRYQDMNQERWFAVQGPGHGCFVCIMRESGYAQASCNDDQARMFIGERDTKQTHDWKQASGTDKADCLCCVAHNGQVQKCYEA